MEHFLSLVPSWYIWTEAVLWVAMSLLVLKAAAQQQYPLIP
jgi:hypothetical protein